jgi:hypothetical protein
VQYLPVEDEHYLISQLHLNNLPIAASNGSPTFEADAGLSLNSNFGRHYFKLGIGYLDDRFDNMSGWNIFHSGPRNKWLGAIGYQYTGKRFVWSMTWHPDYYRHVAYALRASRSEMLLPLVIPRDSIASIGYSKIGVYEFDSVRSITLKNGRSLLFAHYMIHDDVFGVLTALNGQMRVSERYSARDTIPGTRYHEDPWNVWIYERSNEGDKLIGLVELDLEAMLDDYERTGEIVIADNPDVYDRIDSRAQQWHNLIMTIGGRWGWTIPGD